MNPCQLYIVLMLRESLEHQNIKLFGTIWNFFNIAPLCIPF